MTPADTGFWAWALIFIAWCGIRYPAMRRARRARTLRDARDGFDIALLVLCGIALVALPVIWRVGNWPAAANHPMSWWSVAAGMLAGGGFLWLFRRSHADLGRNWSVSLEIRENHSLVTQGVYAWVRHPMYASFFLWGIMQALLIANWIAGLAGVLAIGILYAGRHRREEAMMRAAFGEAYDDYCRVTARLLPGIY